MNSVVEFCAFINVLTVGLTLLGVHPRTMGWLRLVYYGVATISRLLKIIGLFCKRALWKRRYSAKETYHFKEPSNHSHVLLLTASNFQKSALLVSYLVNAYCYCIYYVYTCNNCRADFTRSTYAMYHYLQHVLLPTPCTITHTMYYYLWAGYD